MSVFRLLKANEIDFPVMIGGTPTPPSQHAGLLNFVDHCVGWTSGFCAGDDDHEMLLATATCSGGHDGLPDDFREGISASSTGAAEFAMLVAKAAGMNGCDTIECRLGVVIAPSLADVDDAAGTVAVERDWITVRAVIVPSGSALLSLPEMNYSSVLSFVAVDGRVVLITRTQMLFAFLCSARAHVGISDAMERGFALAIGGVSLVLTDDSKARLVSSDIAERLSSMVAMFAVMYDKGFAEERATMEHCLRYASHFAAASWTDPFLNHRGASSTSLSMNAELPSGEIATFHMVRNRYTDAPASTPWYTMIDASRELGADASATATLRYVTDEGVAGSVPFVFGVSGLHLGSVSTHTGLFELESEQNCFPMSMGILALVPVQGFIHVKRVAVSTLSALVANVFDSGSMAMPRTIAVDGQGRPMTLVFRPVELWCAWRVACRIRYQRMAFKLQGAESVVTDSSNVLDLSLIVRSTLRSRTLEVIVVAPPPVAQPEPPAPQDIPADAYVVDDDEPPPRRDPAPDDASSTSSADVHLPVVVSTEAPYVNLRPAKVFYYTEASFRRHVVLPTDKMADGNDTVKIYKLSSGGGGGDEIGSITITRASVTNVHSILEGDILSLIDFERNMTVSVRDFNHLVDGERAATAPVVDVLLNEICELWFGKRYSMLDAVETSQADNLQLRADSLSVDSILHDLKMILGR